MLTVQAVRFGGPEVLAVRPAPDPVAGPGQAVVRAAAADVLFVDTAIRAGRATDFFPIRPPCVPGNAIAGRVISAGDGVDPGRLGRAGGTAVDYSEPGWTGRVLELTGGQGVDVVFDGAGGELGASSFGIIARGGRFSAHGMSDGGFARLDPAEAGRCGRW